MRSRLANIVLWLTIPLMVIGVVTSPQLEIDWGRWGWLAAIALEAVVIVFAVAIIFPSSMPPAMLRFLQREFLVAAIGSTLLIAASLVGMLVNREFQCGEWIFEFRPAFYSLHRSGLVIYPLDVIPSTYQVEWSNMYVPLTVLCALLMLGYALARRAVEKCVRKANHQCCFVCGYNLTGNTSGFCPECGKAIRLGTAE